MRIASPPRPGVAAPRARQTSRVTRPARGEWRRHSETKPSAARGWCRPRRPPHRRRRCHRLSRTCRPRQRNSPQSEHERARARAWANASHMPTTVPIVGRNGAAALTARDRAPRTAAVIELIARGVAPL
eukprot:scaffold18891_cov135-Isochrysis_galbana.AAC.3